MIDIVLQAMGQRLDKARYFLLHWVTQNSPHLTPLKVKSGNMRIVESIERDGVWSARIIRSDCLLANKGVPYITIPIESSYSMTIDGDIVASDYEGS